MKTPVRRLCSLLLTLIITASFALAVDIDMSRKTLEGLQGMNVVVERFPPMVEQASLTKAAVQTTAELKLRLAGIRVMTREEAEARLHISLDA